MMEKNKELNTESEYPIRFVGRHIAVTDGMKNYVLEKLAKIEKFGFRVLDVTIIMDMQKLVHSVEFILDVNNTKITVNGLSNDMYASIDQAMERLERKIVRYLKKLHMHHAKGIKHVDMTVNIVKNAVELDDINDQIEEEALQKIEDQFTPHQIVSKESMPLKTLTLDEAIMKMELSGDSFLIYRGEEDHRLKVIYRHKEGDFGVVEVETEYNQEV